MHLYVDLSFMTLFSELKNVSNTKRDEKSSPHGVYQYVLSVGNTDKKKKKRT